MLLFLLSACGSTDVAGPPSPPRTPSYGAGVDLPGEPENAPQAQDPASRPDTGAPTPPGGGAAPPDRGAGGSGGEPVAGPRDDGDLGANALFYLRADHPKLVVEINAVSGREPGRDSLVTLQRRLSSVLDKPAGVQVLAPKTFVSDQSVYSLDDISRIERNQRTQHSQGDTVTMHYLFLNGRYEGDTAEQKTLGIAYTSSSIVVFTDQIRAASTPLVTAEHIMRSVLVHEAGHLLRLVNNGYRSPRNHEDPAHRGHTKHEDGVMYWAVESSLVTSLLEGPPPTDFHPDSRADLEDLKAGRL